MLLLCCCDTAVHLNEPTNRDILFESIWAEFPALAEAAASFPCSHGAAAAAVAGNDRAAGVVVAVVVTVAIDINCY